MNSLVKGRSGSDGAEGPAGPVGVRRVLVAVVPSVLAAAVVLAVYLSVAGRLPDRPATHFGAGGKADGFSGRGALLGTALAVLLGMGALLGGLTYRLRSTPGPQRALAVLGAGTAVALGWIITAVLLANARAEEASSATVPGTQAALAFGSAALVAGACWPLCGRDPEAPAAASGPVAGAARLALGDAETAGWSRVAGSRVLPAVGALTAAAGLPVGWTAGWPSALPLLVSGALIALLAGARVTADRRGLTVTPSLAPWPRVTVPLERIAEAGRRTVDPWRDFGGWGYRAVPGASGIVLRSGDAISLRLTTGSEFVVTVDDAATAAALLNTLADRARRTPDGG
ncbi:hypothetical protein GCM10010218_06900 [Streptomyces mashuensis]|uniref:DUF1648 domain-containing protein n=1 Tax=Streptomyces mashuensis TaxID=33904 RepID=A0A919AXW6_9ACTN|nr:DUF1648 domain-containing protein [Streptomyces mashuensis]GHF28399.1 hypothetical protein GCM10010218_06900 [Streptomyces mashuensis]